MKILMFGWEFPPHVSGGLGTACYGMTRALTDQGHEVLFVMPATDATHQDSHVHLIAASEELLADPQNSPTISERMTVATVSSPLHPYLNDLQYRDLLRTRFKLPDESYLAVSGGYGEDLMEEVDRYGRAAVSIAARESFDIIHGHDWMTIPACMEARKISGKPFVLHIHALEFDRSGEHVNQRVYDMERRGMEAADRVIAVSHYTKNMIVDRYSIKPEKIFVVHNAVARSDGGTAPRMPRKTREKVILFMGRITFQKGPDYFVRAADRVLREMPETTFVMAGAGDMMPRMVEQVAKLGIGKRFHFTGFLHNAEVEQIFARSDLYVMPSVSEPFGISPLEAMLYDVPVIISKQSGVSEILHHALKVDFWDVDEMANKMIAVLKYPPLAGELAARAREELRTILWENAASKIGAIYRKTAAAGRA